MGEIILQESVLRKHYSPRCYMGDINIVHPKSTQINDALMLKTSQLDGEWRGKWHEWLRESRVL